MTDEELATEIRKRFLLGADPETENEAHDLGDLIAMFLKVQSPPWTPAVGDIVRGEGGHIPGEIVAIRDAFAWVDFRNSEGTSRLITIGFSELREWEV